MMRRLGSMTTERVYRRAARHAALEGLRPMKTYLHVDDKLNRTLSAWEHNYDNTYRGK